MEKGESEDVETPSEAMFTNKIISGRIEDRLHQERADDEISMWVIHCEAKNLTQQLFFNQ